MAKAGKVQLVASGKRLVLPSGKVGVLVNEDDCCPCVPRVSCRCADNEGKTATISWEVSGYGGTILRTISTGFPSFCYVGGGITYPGFSSIFSVGTPNRFLVDVRGGGVQGDGYLDLAESVANVLFTAATNTAQATIGLSFNVLCDYFDSSGVLFTAQQCGVVSITRTASVGCNGELGTFSSFSGGAVRDNPTLWPVFDASALVAAVISSFGTGEMELSISS
jgi:hypothetical protein